MSANNRDGLEVRPPSYDSRHPKTAGEQILRCVRCIISREISGGTAMNFRGILPAKHAGCSPPLAYKWLNRLVDDGWLNRSLKSYSLTDKGRAEIAPQFRPDCPAGPPTEPLAELKPADYLQAHLQSVIALSQQSGREPAFSLSAVARCVGHSKTAAKYFFNLQIAQGLMSTVGRGNTRGRPYIYRLTALGRTVIPGQKTFLRCPGEDHALQLAELLGPAAEGAWLEAAIQTRYPLDQQSTIQQTVARMMRLGVLSIKHLTPETFAQAQRTLGANPALDPITAKTLLPGPGLARLSPERCFQHLESEGVAPLIYASAQLPQPTTEF